MSVALSYGNTIIRFGNVAISAGVVSPIYNVSLIQDAHGTIAASPMSGHPNQTVTLSNTPATHYHFDSYSVSGATLTGNQFKLVDQDVTAKGTFVEDDKYNLTLQTNGYGTISASKTTGYAGDTVTLSNTPSADCTFASYAITGATLTGNQFNFGSSDVTAKANFNRNVHSVTTQTNGYGSLVASPTTGYSGTQVTLTTAANAGYLFSGYTITGATLTGNKFNIGTSNVTAKAWYKAEPDPYSAFSAGWTYSASAAFGLEIDPAPGTGKSNCQIRLRSLGGFDKTVNSTAVGWGDCFKFSATSAGIWNTEWVDYNRLSACTAFNQNDRWGDSWKVMKNLITIDFLNRTRISNGDDDQETPWRGSKEYLLSVPSAAKHIFHATRVTNVTNLFRGCVGITGKIEPFIQSMISIRPTLTARSAVSGCFSGCTNASDYATARSHYPNWF